MRRLNKETAEIIKTHEITMLKAPSFDLWCKRHCKFKTNLTKYKKAFDFIHGKQIKEEDLENEQEIV